MAHIDCLVVGHFDSPIEQLAARLRPNRDNSGAFTEIRTNSVRVDGRQLSYSELFGELCRRTWGAEVELNPFNAPHSGAIFLASRLRRAGLSAEVACFVSDTGRELTRALTELNPRVVAITTTFYVEPSPILQLVEYIRAVSEDAFIVVGGPFVTSRTINDPSSVPAELGKLGVDALITDPQGEQALIELVQRVRDGLHEVGGVSNVVRWNGEAGPIVNRRMRESNNLHDHTVRWRDFTSELAPRLAFLRTARGCSFRCAFCNYPAMAGGHDLAEIDAVCDELELLHSLGVRHVAFVDDTFNVPLPRFKKLLKQIVRRGIGMSWTSFFRCSNADEETFDLLAAAGCEAVFLGIESGDADILKGMNKAAKPEAYMRGIRALRDRDIMTMGSYIIGFPGETVESAQRTLEFIQQNPTDFYNVQLYYHDEKAPIEGQRERYDLSGGGYMWEHMSMDWREGADWVEYAMSMDGAATPLPLYGFSIWSLPYFQALGFSREHFRGFTGVAAQMFRDGLTGEVELDDYTAEFSAAVPLDRIRASGLRVETSAS